MSGGKGGGEVTVGYKYYMGGHFVLCHGPIDHFSEITVDDRRAWVGYVAPDSDNPGDHQRITIKKPELFGGKSREGGISGKIDALFGYPEQPVSSYLQDKIGSLLVPAYRGITSVVLRQCYMGNNPYLKPWSFLCQRIHTRNNGDEQWYNQKAAIFSEFIEVPEPQAIYIAIDGSGSMFPPSSNRFDTVKSVMNAFFNALSAADAKHDILVNVWGGSTSIQTWYDASIDDLSAANDFVKSIDSKVGDGTDFNMAVSSAESFFNASGKPRRYIFLTDGDPNPNQSAAQASATLGAIPDLVAHAFNIDLTDTSNTELMDNTEDDGVPVINGDDAGGMLQSILGWIGSPLFDENPIHIIRECLTNPTWGRGLPETEIGPSYQIAADQIFEEGLGVSIQWTQESPIDEFIAEIMRHIDAVRYEDPETGLQEITLIRGDYDVESLPVLDQSNSSVTKYDETAYSELVNQVTVQYHSRASDDTASVTVQDTAAITQLGGIINATYDYPGLCSDTVATMVAQRDLATGSRPFARGTVITNRKVYDLKPGDVFKLSDPDLGIEEMVCRVASRTENGILNGEITLEFGEDVFGTDYSIISVPSRSSWVPVGPPEHFSFSTAYERLYSQIVSTVGDSYIDQIPTDACYYNFAGARSVDGAHLNYDLYVYADGTTQEPDFEVSVRADFTPYAVVDGDIDPTETTLPISKIEDVDNIRVGHLVLIGDASDDLREVAALTAVLDDESTEISLTRGVSDTTPRPITSGTVIYFIGTATGKSDTEYLDGEVVEGYGTPVNGQGYYLGPYTYHDVEMQGRFLLPYPAANLQIDGQYFPDDFVLSADSVTLTWNHRDRVLQSDQIIDWFEDADYGPETGTTFRVESDALDENGDISTAAWFSQDVGLTNSYVFDIAANSPPAGAVSIFVKVIAVRDGLDSLQAPGVKIDLIKAPTGLSAAYKPHAAPTNLTGGII